MRFLIDSHTLIWWRAGSPALSSVARDAIADASNETLISVAALWEITIKQASGKLSFSPDLEAIVADEGFQVLQITFEHLRHFGILPRIHGDPFDRMMIAQALAEGVAVATVDRRFAAYGVQIIW